MKTLFLASPAVNTGTFSKVHQHPPCPNHLGSSLFCLHDARQFGSRFAQVYKPDQARTPGSRHHLCHQQAVNEVANRAVRLLPGKANQKQGFQLSLHHGCRKQFVDKPSWVKRDFVPTLPFIGFTFHIPPYIALQLHRFGCKTFDHTWSQSAVGGSFNHEL